VRDATKAPQRIAGRYRIERPIGRGGMGTVWLCRDERLERDVAIKQIGTLPGETAPDLARAMREARSSAALNHPHVVSIYNVVEEDGHIWLVMEYVASRTLAQVIAQDGPLSPQATAGIGVQIAEALLATHAAGTIHRDVKPGNILVTPEGVAKLSDFGIARAHDQSQLTRSGQVIGTPMYFAPELARGEKPTPAADVWALGASLYAAVEGHPPYEDKPNVLALLATIASTPPTQTRRAGFLKEPIERMLDPDPGSRWSMADAAHALGRLGRPHPQPPMREATVEPTRPSDRAPVVVPAAISPPTGTAARTAEGQAGWETAPEKIRARREPGALVLAGLAGLVALAAVIGFLLLQGGPADRLSAQDPAGSSPAARHSTTAGSSTSPSVTSPSPSVTSTPTTSEPTATPSATKPTSTPEAATGATAEQFVRSYYAALPSRTQTAWSALSPGFQDKIGGYGNYQGFWSTVSRVSVGDTTSAGNNAVDVSLVYTRSDGGSESEVRRLFLERRSTGYLITGDSVIG
jgi:eukaryotic-like serine/threonine-protein kinase